MNSTEQNRTGCETYIDGCTASIKRADNVNNRDSELLLGLTCNCNSKTTEAVVIIVKPDAIMSGACLQYHFSTWGDGITRWRGKGYNNVISTLKGGKDAIRCVIPLGKLYKDIEKDASGTRAQAIEKAVTAGLANVYPWERYEYEFGYDYEIDHIGNNRKKGWRDVAIYAKATDSKPRTRIALIEVKSHNGRMQ